MASASPFKRLFTGTVLYGLGGLLSRFVSLLILPIFTARLAPADYGVIGILSVFSMCLGGVFTLGFGTSLGICYFEGGSRERKEATVWTAFAILLTSACLVALGGVGFAGPISQALLGTAAHGGPVILSMVTAALSILAMPLMLAVQLDERAKVYALATLGSTLLTVLLSVLLVLGFDRGVVGMLEAGLVGQALSLGLFMTVIARSHRFRLEKRVAVELLRLGAPMIPSFASLYVLAQANRFVLQEFKGLDSVGLYSIGSSFGMLMSLAVTAFQNAWAPFFLSYSEKLEEAPQVLGRAMTYYVLIFGGISLFFYAVAKPAVMTFTQPAYHEAFTIVGLTATAQFLVGIYNVLLPGVYFAKEVKATAVVQGIAAAIAIGLNFLLIPRWGMLGAALALILGYLIMDGLQHAWNVYRRQSYVRITYAWGRIVPFMALYVVLAPLTLWDRAWPLGMELGASLVMALGVAALVVAMLTREERNGILRLVSGRFGLGRSQEPVAGPHGP